MTKIPAPPTSVPHPPGPHAKEEDLLTFHWDGGRRIGAHVAACPECTARLAELRAVLRAAESIPVPERGESYGREVWARIAPRLSEERTPRSHPIFSWLPSLSVLAAPRTLILAGSLAAVAVAAFLAGRLAFTAPPAPPVRTAQAGRDRVLFADLASHLDRSEAVLLELVHGSGSDGDVAAEQARLTDLLPANRLYRQTARRSGQAAVSGLLEEIERVLLEVEHGPTQLTDAERETLRRRIDSEGILFRLRILSARVRQLERDAAPPTFPERKRA